MKTKEEAGRGREPSRISHFGIEIWRRRSTCLGEGELCENVDLEVLLMKPWSPGVVSYFVIDIFVSYCVNRLCACAPCMCVRSVDI